MILLVIGSASYFSPGAVLQHGAIAVAVDESDAIDFPVRVKRRDPQKAGGVHGGALCLPFRLLW